MTPIVSSLITELRSILDRLETNCGSIGHVVLLSRVVIAMDKAASKLNRLAGEVDAAANHKGCKPCKNHECC